MQQQAAAAAPLGGVRILDFSHGVAGPYATMLLADLGCEVLKVEHPSRGDATRYMNMSPNLRGGIPYVGGDYFMAINRNKKSVTLNLKAPAAVEICQELVKGCDIAVQNFRPGVIERLGLGYDVLSAANPSLIYASLSGYGDQGPLAGQGSMDIAIQARTGLMSITGPSADGAPLKAGGSFADFSGGAHLASAIMAAYIHRLRTGEGQFVSVSLLSALTSMLTNYSVAVLHGGAHIAPVGSGHPQLVPFQAFEAADGYIVVGPGTNKLFRAFCDILGLSDLSTDERFLSNERRVENREVLVPVLENAMRARSVDKWTAAFDEAGIPSAPVNTLEQAFRSEQLKANGMIAQVTHPQLGPMEFIRAPYDLSASKVSVTSPPPTLGEHTESILSELANIKEDEFRELRARGVV